jgi:coenzyme F420-reducing hydrogenase alpha subunit
MSKRKITINPIIRLEGHGKIEKILEDKKWKERTIPDPTLLLGLIRNKKE